MGRKILRKGIFLFYVLMLVLLPTGCKKDEETPAGKLNDLEFTVVEEADLPEELLKIINEKKENPFKLSYTSEDSLYIARGYGAQRSGGYSITVKELYLSEQGIYFQTELIGPSQEDLVSQAITHPYIVVKLEKSEQPVIYSE